MSFFNNLHQIYPVDEPGSYLVEQRVGAGEVVEQRTVAGRRAAISTARRIRDMNAGPYDRTPRVPRKVEVWRVDKKNNKIGDRPIFSTTG